MEYKTTEFVLACFLITKKQRLLRIERKEVMIKKIGIFVFEDSDIVKQLVEDYSFGDDDSRMVDAKALQETTTRLKSLLYYNLGKIGK